MGKDIYLCLVIVKRHELDKKYIRMTPFFNLYSAKVILGAFLFITVNTTHVHNNETIPIDRIESNEIQLTSAFISTWKVKEVRDHAVIEVLTTNDFITAHNLIEKLRKIIDEPILVKHNYVDNSISYEIIVGRFNSVVEAEVYHDLLK